MGKIVLLFTNIEILKMGLTFGMLTLAICFFIAAVLLYRVLAMNSGNSTVSQAELVGFRQEYNDISPSVNNLDYLENKKGRVPLVRFLYEGEYAVLPVELPDLRFQKEDIGKTVTIRYRKNFMGFTIIIEDFDEDPEDSALKRYDRYVRKKVKIFIGISIFFAILAILIFVLFRI